MKKIFLLPLVCLVFACSSNNDPDDLLTQNVNTPFLKSRTFTEEPANHAQNAIFTVENGFLISATGLYYGDYEYDANGRLLQSGTASTQFLYEYDIQGRITKQIEVGNEDCFVELVYGEGKIISKLVLNHGSGNPVIYDHELSLDNEGRIIRVEALYDNPLIEWQVYEYNALGNMNRITTKRRNNPVLTRNYTYHEDIKNPYHDLLKKYYQSAYYIRNYAGFGGGPWDLSGVSPNVLVTNSTFEANADGYPETEMSPTRGLIAYEYE